MRRHLQLHSSEVVDDEIADILRRKSPAERIQLTCDANDAARHMMAAGIRYANPNWSEDKIQQEVARRMLVAAGISDIRAKQLEG